MLKRSWLPLLLLLFGILLPFLIFGRLIEDVWKQSGGVGLDVPILLAVHRMEQPALDTFAIYLSNLGVFWGVFPVAIAIMLFLLSKRYWHKLAYWLTVLGGSIVINLTLKQLIHRVRPHLWQSPAPEFDFSFPSGHAMSSMTLVMALIILTWKTRLRMPIAVVGITFVVLVGWARLYLGVHYPSDIVAGWTVSIAWAVGVGFLINPIVKKRLFVKVNR